MLALSLTQPWATLVAIGAKKCETRSWGLSHKLPLTIAVHAAKGLAGMTQEEYRALARSEPYFGPALRAGGYPMAGIKHFDDLPRGAIVAVCDVVDCVPTTNVGKPGGPLTTWRHGANWWLLTDQERAFGDYSEDRFVWLLANIRALPEPISCKGALGLWHVDAAVEAAIASQPIRVVRVGG